MDEDQVEQLSQGTDVEISKDGDGNIHHEYDQVVQVQNMRSSLCEQKRLDRYGYEPNNFNYFVLSSNVANEPINVKDVLDGKDAPH